MEIAKGIEIRGLSLYLKKEKILILGDIHIGYEEDLRSKGLQVPMFQFKQTMDEFQKILALFTVDKLIINGDIKHEFGTISDTEWQQSMKIIDYLKEHCNELILVKGNHDTILGPIAHKKGLEIKEYYKTGDYYICHGHKIPKNKDYRESKIVIIGHEHPALGLESENRREIYKCFLKGKYKDKTIIVMPSFNMLTEGTDILKEKVLSPFLKQDLSNFEAWIADEETYYFGKLKEL